MKVTIETLNGSPVTLEEKNPHSRLGPLLSTEDNTICIWSTNGKTNNEILCEIQREGDCIVVLVNGDIIKTVRTK